MDCKIISKLIIFIFFFSTTNLNAIEFKGKFLQGHYIIGITDPFAEIIIDKKKVIELLKEKTFNITHTGTNIEYNNEYQ